MEKNELLWKKAEQSFVDAYDFAVAVMDGKQNLSQLEKERLLKLLKLWLSALENMIEHASDAEMTRDFQVYYNKLECILQRSEEKFFN